MSSQRTDEEIRQERERADEAQRRLEEATRREKQREIEQTMLLMTLIDN